MEQNKKQNKVKRFEVLNGRDLGCCQIAILKRVVKVSLIKVKFEQRFEGLKKFAKQVAKRKAFQAEATRQESQGKSVPPVFGKKQVDKCGSLG